jgi:ubiquinone/menaquinone biosynthesis C-methylase UbiE
MADHVCPPWVGYLLLSPLRRLFENPDRMLGPFIQPGMTVLEPGPGMGYFTLPMARMVGPEGRVVAVDLQPKMLETVRRRAQKAGLSQVVETRLAQGNSLGVEDLSGQVDFAAAIHLVHEVPDSLSFLGELKQTLKPQGRLLVIEPKFHVKVREFAKTVGLIEETGFRIDDQGTNVSGRVALLRL